MGDKAKAAGGTILRYLITIGLFIALVAGGAAVSKYVSSHNKQFSKADYEDMNPLVEAGEELPVGKLGRLSIRWVPGCFAEEENYQTSYGIKFGSGKSYYYVAVLDDRRVIAIQASDEAEIKRLDKMAEDYASHDDVSGLPAQDFEGKIEKLTNKELKQYYDEVLLEGGFKRINSGLSIQYLILNTSAIPTQNTLLYIGIGAAVIVAVILIARARKKRNQPADPPANQPDDSFTAPDQPAS